MTNKILRIATRKSPLALWQAQHVAQRLIEHWPNLQVELVPMVTSGDQFLKDKLLTIGGKGLFVKELEHALLNNKADLAVHSMKDVPVNFPKGLTLKTICKRENPYDAFVSNAYTSLQSLPIGASVGTSSLRRQSQLLALRPDLNIIPLRGNIHTRIALLDASEFDAIILAAAGLLRMNLQHLIKEIIIEENMLPAPGQGALGIECRSDDETVLNLIDVLNDKTTAICVNSERLVNELLGGNCHVPLAVFCKIVDETQVLLQAKVASPDGKIIIYDNQKGDIDNALKLAEKSANILLKKGAKELLNKC